MGALSRLQPFRAAPTPATHVRDLGGFRSDAAELAYRAAYDEVLGLWPVPFTERTVATPFAHTHVIVSGPEDGPPLVLLHATGMSSTVWFPNVGELSKEHRTFAVDIVNEPGRTRQTRLVRDTADCAAWLLALLDQLGIARATLVGSSFGGWHAINVALRAPQRVEKLVLLAPAASLLPFGVSTYLLLRSLPYWPVKPGGRRVLRMYLPGFGVDPRRGPHPRHADPARRRPAGARLPGGRARGCSGRSRGGGTCWPLTAIDDRGKKKPK